MARRSELIAAYFGYDWRKAFLAGLLHDCAKELSNEELIKVCEDHDIPLGKKDYEEAHYLHGAVGAILAYEQYGVRDEEVLYTIANHSGRPDMEPLEKVVMISDLIDKALRENLDVTFLFKAKTIDQAFLLILRLVTQYCVDNNIYMAERTRDAFDYILDDQIYKKYARPEEDYDVNILSDDGNSIVKYSAEELEDIGLINAIRVNKLFGIPLKSVANIRELGGYETKNEGKVKKHMLIRSASLTNLSEEDANFLKVYGIDTIIDLRDAYEVKQNPDVNIDGFRYINCPFSMQTPQLNNFRQRMEERKKQTFSKGEETWYNVQSVLSLDMKKMYENVVFNKECTSQMSKIFSMLLDSRHHGVLFHCASGKDRVGLFSIFLLYVLGVQYDNIRNDYFASMMYGFSAAENLAIDMANAGYDKAIVDNTRKILSVSVDILPEVYKEVCKRYKNIDAYLEQELDLTAEKREKLVSKFTIF